jgi:hypothetical protein
MHGQSHFVKNRAKKEFDFAADCELRCFCACPALPLESLDLEPERVVLLPLSRQKLPREIRLGCDAFRRKQVDVATLVGAFAEVLNFDETLTQKSSQAIIRFAQTDAHLARHFPLREPRAGVEKAKDAQNRRIGYEHRDLGLGVLLFVQRLNIVSRGGYVNRGKGPSEKKIFPPP